MSGRRLGAEDNVTTAHAAVARLEREAASMLILLDRSGGARSADSTGHTARVAMSVTRCVWPARQQSGPRGDAICMAAIWAGRRAIGIANRDTRGLAFSTASR